MRVLGLRKRFVVAILLLPFVFCAIAMLSLPIRIQYVYSVLPVFIGVSPKILPDGAAAIQRGMFVFVDPQFLYNEKIIKHELVHVKQYYRTISISYWWAMFSDKHLVDIEAEAYITEAQSPKDFGRLANLIKEEYAPDISKEYIINRLQMYWTQRS